MFYVNMLSVNWERVYDWISWVVAPPFHPTENYIFMQKLKNLNFKLFRPFSFYNALSYTQMAYPFVNVIKFYMFFLSPCVSLYKYQIWKSLLVSVSTIAHWCIFYNTHYYFVVLFARNHRVNFLVIDEGKGTCTLSCIQCHCVAITSCQLLLFKLHWCSQKLSYSCSTAHIIIIFKWRYVHALWKAV